MAFPTSIVFPCFIALYLNFPFFACICLYFSVYPPVFACGKSHFLIDKKFNKTIIEKDATV
jgi:hypothetical protein